MTGVELTELVDQHVITVEKWSRGVVLLCSCQSQPLSHRQVEGDAGPYTTDDADGLTLRELADLAAAHLAAVTGADAGDDVELTEAHWEAAADALVDRGHEVAQVAAVARAIAEAEQRGWAGGWDAASSCGCGGVELGPSRRAPR